MVEHTESGFRSSQSILWTSSTRVDNSNNYVDIYHVIFIAVFLKCLDLVSITTEHLLYALVVITPLGGSTSMTHWGKKCYNKFDIQCSGGHRMMFTILPRNIFPRLSFVEITWSFRIPASNLASSRSK